MNILKLAQEFERLATWEIGTPRQITNVDRPSREGKHNVETHLMKQYGFTRTQAALLLKSLSNPRKLQRLEDEGGYELLGFGRMRTPNGREISLELLQSAVMKATSSESAE